jgi:hypothetical protein
LRGSAGPQVLNGVRGLLGSLGIPLDNHLAVSNDGMVATVANFHLATYDKEGNYIKAVSLIQLTRDLALPDFRFDPRIIYDPSTDKFILVMLHSTDRDRNSIIVAFSETNDPNGNWHLYVLDGNPFDINIFSDYPMISITNDHLYITVNAVNVDSTWQAGFVESYIWELGKAEGHIGQSLITTMYNDVLYGNKPIRNLCPVTPGDENLLDVQYFLSNRNFDVENDTIFLIKFDNGQISTTVLKASMPYGVPPNAVQGQNSNLQTNDARILDAFLQDGHVQFVGNCVNPNNGFAVIYHGLIEDIEASSTAQGSVISYGDLELGYPDIAYVGTKTGDRQSIIVTSHVGEGRFPGVSALEFDGTDFSELVTLHEGEGQITQIGGSLQRWGDYSGNQRKYNEPGVCWTVSSFGRNDREYGIWISELAESEVMVNNRNYHAQVESNLFPNPSFDWVTIDFDIPNVNHIKIEIASIDGKYKEEIVDLSPKRTGPASFKFSTSQLSSGNYIVSAVSSEGVLFTKPLTVQH